LVTAINDSLADGLHLAIYNAVLLVRLLISNFFKLMVTIIFLKKRSALMSSGKIELVAMRFMSFRNKNVHFPSELNMKIR